MSEILIFEGLDLPDLSRGQQRQIAGRARQQARRNTAASRRGEDVGFAVVEVGRLSGLGESFGSGDGTRSGDTDFGMEPMYREPASQSEVFNVSALTSSPLMGGGFAGETVSWQTVLTASGMVRTQTFWKNHYAWALALRTMANQKPGWARQHARGLLTVLKSLKSLGFGFGNGTKGTDYLVPYVDTQDIEYLMLKPEAVARLAKDISKPLSMLLGANPYGQIMAYRQQLGIVSPHASDSQPRTKTGEDALTAGLEMFNRNVDLPGGGSIPTSQEELEEMARRNAERAAAALAEQMAKIGIGAGKTGRTPAPTIDPEVLVPGSDSEGKKLFGLPWWLPVGGAVLGIGIIVWMRRRKG